MSLQRQANEYNQYATDSFLVRSKKKTRPEYDAANYALQRLSRKLISVDIFNNEATLFPPSTGLKTIFSQFHALLEYQV